MILRKRNVCTFIQLFVLTIFNEGSLFHIIANLSSPHFHTIRVKREQNRTYIVTLKLLQLLVTLHTYTTIHTRLVTKHGIYTIDEL